MSVGDYPYNMHTIFPVEHEDWVEKLREHWNEIQLTSEFKALAMWCLIHSFCSDNANMPSDAAWMTSMTTGPIWCCNVPTMGNLLSKSAPEVSTTMTKLEDFDTSGMKDLMSRWTLLDSTEFDNLAASTKRELLTQMQLTIATYPKTPSSRRSPFEKSLKSILDECRFLSGFAWQISDMEKFFHDDEKESVEDETFERDSQWVGEVTIVHTLLHATEATGMPSNGKVKNRFKI
jgi:hypothetical protein